MSEIDSLTGARGIAALSIALAHIGLNVNVGAFNLGCFAIIGMPMFFTLSGFVIHYVYAAPLSQRHGFGEFGIARFARLWPLFLAYYLWFAVRTPFGDIGASSSHWLAMVSYLTLTFSWFPFLIEGKAPIQHYYGVSWSISTEVFFYIAYALGLYRLVHIRRVSICAITLLLFCIGVFALMAVLFVTRDSWETFALLLGIDMPTRRADSLNSFYRWFLYVSPYIRVFEFIGGCLTCQLFLLMRQRHDLLQRFSAQWISSLGVVGILVPFLFYSWFASMGPSPWMSKTVLKLVEFVLELHLNFLLAPGCYLLFLGLALGSSAVGKVLSARVAVHLGTVSYSIYLGHVVALSFAYVGPEHPNKALGVALSLALTIAMATGTYLLIEWPGRTVFRFALGRLLLRRRAAPAAAPAE